MLRSNAGEAISQVGRLKQLSLLAASSAPSLCKRLPAHVAPLDGIIGQVRTTLWPAPPLLLRIPTAAAGYNTHALGRRDRPLQSSLGGFMEERGLSTTPGPRHRDVLRTLGPQVCHPSNRRQIGQSYESCSKHGLSSTMMALITSGIVAACSSVRATSPCPSPAWRTAPPTTPRTSTRSSWSCRLGTGELCHTP